MPRTSIPTSACLKTTYESTIKVGGAPLPVFHSLYSNAKRTVNFACCLLFLVWLTGSGKNHKDAASVRTAHPIPAACGVYYFEIKVISKGRDGSVILYSTVCRYGVKGITFECSEVCSTVGDVGKWMECTDIVCVCVRSLGTWE